MENRPKVGVGVLIFNKERKVLLGKRKNAHGEGSWCFPGGHLEFNEEPEDTAIRETMEEVGIKIKNLKRGHFTNDIHKERGKHYITIFIIAEYDAGEIKTLEPEKCEGWQWFSWDNLPKPLFLPIQNLLKQGYNPFD